jgi:hypothetical protein
VYCCSEIGKINEADVLFILKRPCMSSSAWSNPRWRILSIALFLLREYARQK